MKANTKAAKDQPGFSRRRFLHKTAAAVCLSACAPQIIPSSVLGMGGATSPNNRIAVGFIGTGDHGVNWNLGPYLRHKDAQVIAACDVDSNRLFRASETINDFYKNEDCFVTKDFREILARKDIDAVMISTPDHWHTIISILAIQAGKDVQCEKPTLTIDEGKLLIQAVRKHQKVFQTSTEDRAVPEYHRMAELVRNGRIGKLQRIEVILPKQPQQAGDPTPQPVPKELDYEMWLGPAPFAPYTRDRVHWNFRWIWDYSGGIICDWGTHLFDTAQWANDTERSGPVEIDGKGTHWTDGLYDTVKDYDVTYRYANGVVMTCKPGNPSLKFIGTDGWVGNTGWRGPVQASSREILNSKVGENEVRLYTNPQGEHDDFLQCVRSRKDPYFPVDIGHRVSTVCHLANLAIKLGRKLKWNPDAEQFVGDNEANKLLDRPRRDPWQLPKV
ncbi:MAG: Gfo/Idh/MocA family oxidoreductase [Verrucomicrobia bacterium]|nr:Gfo/Idh/MocA family oxidoreductase [Verrucomicrobiota bacterium]